MTSTSSTVAVVDGQLTDLGRTLSVRIAKAVADEAMKTGDPIAYIAAWTRDFHEGMAALGAGSAR